MVLRSTVLGVLCTVSLVALLALSRQFGDIEMKQFELTEMETIVLEPPPAPPEITPEEELEETPPPPAPCLELPTDMPQMDVPQIKLSLDKVPLTTAMQVFNIDLAPAPVPVRPVTKPKPQKKLVPQLNTTKRKKAPVAKKPAYKSFYSSGELDMNPRQRYAGKYTWPRSASGTSASVKLLIEIDSSGYVKVISVISSSNKALNTAAIKVASGSRFTSPLHKGKPVKARFYKNYTLKKR